MSFIRLQNSSEILSVGKILCVGKNYANHAKEMGGAVPTTPIIFMKPSSALIHTGEAITVPSFGGRKISNVMHYETELVVAISQQCKNVSEHDAASFILGYGVGLDMTLRDLQDGYKKAGQPWLVAKGFDTSAVVSDIVPASEIKNPYDLKIHLAQNGVTVQDGIAGDMIFKINFLISYLSHIFTLELGDLIYTGTPEGVGETKSGDTLLAQIGLAKPDGFASVASTRNLIA
jgi:acylpyruvate hydrolase